nr:PREDICTED: irregular chiasm C-roughest protein-like isoform X1 [Bemisia tabaci]
MAFHPSHSPPVNPRKMSVSKLIGQVLWTSLCVLCLVCAVVGEQKLVREPQDQTATVGSHVTLPCRVVNKSGSLQWTKDHFGLGEERNMPGFERYSMVGNDEEGDFGLDINPVTLDDDGTYRCQVAQGKNGDPRIISKQARLTVLVPPEPPKITQGESLTATEDQHIEIECISAGGKPPADITWIDETGGQNKKIEEGIQTITEPYPLDDKKWTTKSVLQLVPKKEHHNATFTCQAQNQAERYYQSARLKLYVKYAPKVTVSIDGPLIEGSDVRLSCFAEANPSEVTYRWYVNSHEQDETGTELVLRNISAAMHDSIVKCKVKNAVGESEDSETLFISYGPVFRQKPHSVQVEENSHLTLTCDVDGNPTPEINWFHRGTNSIVGSSANLSIIATSDKAGRYTCQATVRGFPPIEADATVILKGPPTIVSHRLQFGVPGDSVELECIAYSIPPPQKFVWMHNGQELDLSTSGDYVEMKEHIPGGIKSKLTVREAQQYNFGVYNCSVSNQYGSDTFEIILKPQKNFPLLMLLAAIIGGVAVVIFVTLVVILCQRKEKKPSANDLVDSEKQCKESDRSSNISDLKLELRTTDLDYGGHESETSESVVTRVGVPLAGPVPLYNTRLSTSDCNEPVFPPKSDGHNNNGYIPYVDYQRDYNPPPPPPAPEGVDVRYSATYGNPFLRTAPSPALPPPPPPYSSVRNGGVPRQHHQQTSPTSQYITHQPAVKRGTLATHV